MISGKVSKASKSDENKPNIDTIDTFVEKDIDFTDLDLSEEEK
jgi:hypothetical protein